MHTCHSTTCGNSSFLSTLWVLRNWQLVRLDSKCLYLLGHHYLTLKIFIFQGRNSLVMSSHECLAVAPVSQPHFVPERFLSLSQIFHEHHLAGVLLCLVHVTGRYCSQAVLFMLWYEFSLLHFSIPNTHRGDVPCFVTHCTRGLTADCCEQPCFEHLCVVLQTNFSLLLSVSLGVE